MISPDRIPLSEALDVYFRHLRLPPEVTAKVRKLVSKKEGGVIWLSDQPLMVYEEVGEFFVDRSELDLLLRKVVRPNL